MTFTGAMIGLVGSALLLEAFAGLLLRRHVRQWYAFAVYLLVTAGFTLFFIRFPESYRPPEYLLQLNAQNIARLAMALELAARTFRAFPGARSTLRSVLLLVVLVIFALLVSLTTARNDYESFLAEMQPRLLNGTVWIFTAIAALVLWYRLPVASLHKSILISYVPFLIWDAVFLHLLLPLSWDQAAVGYVNQGLTILLYAHWVWVAWRAGKPTNEAPHDPFESMAAVVH